MSPSRIQKILSGRFFSPRIALCVLLGAICLSAFPRRSALTFSSPAASSENSKASRTHGASAGERFANLSKRTSLKQLPEPNEVGGASLSMVSGDFDEDGVPDLAAGFQRTAGAGLILYEGNADSVYADSPEARRNTINGSKSPASLSPTKSVALASVPNFLIADDFDGDGHLDVAFAARGGDAFHVLAGDGRGDFVSSRKIELIGRVTALGSADSSVSGGLAYIAVGIVDDSGPAVLLFRSLGSKPLIIRTPAEVATVAFRRSSLRNATDLLIAAGNELLVRPIDVTEAEAARAPNRNHFFSSELRSVTIGNFAGNQGSAVAVLTSDGAVSILTEAASGNLSESLEERFALGAWPGSTQLIRARISGSNKDDLVAIDPEANRLHLLIEDPTTGSLDSAIAQSRVSVSIELENAPFAALPMRLTEAALNNLVILCSGRIAPMSLHISAAMTFQVINTADSGAGSLRQAILDANGNPGVDTINFNIAGAAPHSIGLLSPLPAITEAVTINGASQPDFAGSPVVELNGINAGAGDGLILNSASSTVRGLVINRFNGNGIVVSGNGNITEGNFIGTNATGAFALANTLDGVFVNSGSSTVIGGTTSAARNVISGNRNGVQISSSGTSNQVRGNFIGTSAAGTSGIGNSANGVLIGGSSGNSVGSVGSASSNTIAFNGSAGVAVTSGVSNLIQSNSIFSNGGLGIDLGPAGVTSNDAGDGDAGANNLQNFPVLDSANAAGTSTTIQGKLNSAANTSFRLEFFSNQAPNPSGFGEGQTFIGSINVTTSASGDVTFNPTFPVTVPPGQIITSTATDPGNNTSEFSKSIQVGGLTGGTPADLSVITSIAPSPVESGAQVTKTILVTNAGPATATTVTVSDVLSSNLSFVSCNSTGGGVCGGSANNRTVTFASLAPGTTAVITIVANVNCSVSNGTIIGNTATIFSASTPDPTTSNNVSTANTIASNPPPRITCPANITQINDSGRCAALVNYFLPPVTDNCPLSSVICSPPSGSDFTIGTTTVTCVATDAGGLTATCSFTVTVTDFQPITVSCPANVTVTASAGQCSPVVNYPAPAVIDNCPGFSVRCVPPSGSTFPLGVTGVVCTAVDAKGVQATCGFTVSVTGTPQAVVALQGGGNKLDFGTTFAAKKVKKLKKLPVRTFTVENVGCIQLVLTFKSLNRIGADVVGGRISDPDDRKLFDLSLVDAAGNETSLDILSDVRIAPGQKQIFKVRFIPIIPAVAKGTKGLTADQALPDEINSVLTFAQNGGPDIEIRLVGHLDTALTLINPENPRSQPLVIFSRVENEFIIEYSIYDPNLDVNKATYQFLDKRNRPAAPLISVDLTALIRQAGFVRGQSFTLEQRFNGAKDHPEIVAVQVTVSDSESSSSFIAVLTTGTFNAQVLSGGNVIGAKLLPPDLALTERKRISH